MVRFRKTVAVAMSFIFLASPLAPVFADEGIPETSTETAPVPETETSPIEPVIEAPASDDLIEDVSETLPEEIPAEEEVQEEEEIPEDENMMMDGGEEEEETGNTDGTSSAVYPDADEATGALTYQFRQCAGVQGRHVFRRQIQ